MRQYTVKPNDTLYSIAKEFNVPLAQLIKANPQIENPNLIYEGQTVMIPDLPAVPAQLSAIESNALNIIEDIIMGDWDTAFNRINTIRTDMSALIPMLQDAQVPGNLIREMNMAIRILEQNILQRRTFPAISQANQITYIIANMLDYFSVIIPTDVRRMAYFARQIIVNVEQNDWDEARRNYQRIVATWQKIRPDLVQDYAKDVADLDQVLNSLGTSMDRRDYQSAINNSVRILEILSSIAADFEQMYT